MSDPFLLGLNHTPVEESNAPRPLSRLKLPMGESVKIRILDVPNTGQEKFTHYICPRGKSKPDPKEPQCCSAGLPKRFLISGLGFVGEAFLERLLAEVEKLVQAPRISIDFETVGLDSRLDSYPTITIDSISAVHDVRIKRRERREPKRAKGYQPPAWVTRRARSY